MMMIIICIYAMHQSLSLCKQNNWTDLILEFSYRRLRPPTAMSLIINTWKHALGTFLFSHSAQYLRRRFQYRQLLSICMSATFSYSRERVSCWKQSQVTCSHHSQILQRCINKPVTSSEQTKKHLKRAWLKTDQFSIQLVWVDDANIVHIQTNKMTNQLI